MSRRTATAMTRGALVMLALLTLALLTWLSPGAVAQRALRIGQPAPEITGAPWINSEPLSLDKLRGRAVLVEFWTYG